ncbi:MAG: hypothetical protein M1837_003879 [Sclerophora amabilis]|nr:MAG: hypothetical protein M1837_003879 [Sclerophora amabilis]
MNAIRQLSTTSLDDLLRPTKATLHAILKVVVLISLFAHAVYFYILHRRQVRNLARHAPGRRIHEPPTYHPPPPLPSRRPRALTLPLPDPGFKWPRRRTQKTFAQTGSALFRLPAEIRNQIYNEVLVNQTPLALVNTPHKLSLLRFGRWEMLPLLRSCRRVYSEAVGIIYEENTFRFHGLQDLDHFKAVILPPRWHAIRSLVIIYGLHFYLWSRDPNDPIVNPDLGQIKSSWKRTWGTIARMQGLKELRMTISLVGEILFPGHKEEAELYKPMRQVKGLDIFELTIPRPWGKAPGVELPFTLLRPDNDFGKD